MSEWQPIETAPKDRSRILLGRFVDHCEEGRNGYISTDYWRTKEIDGWDGFGAFNSTYWPATHWMPLPKPPAMAQGENGC